MNKTIPPAISILRPGGVMHFGQHNLGGGHEDPYHARGKYREPTVCSDCHAVFHDGHWAWGAEPPRAAHARCPACRRIREKMPAGTLVLEGPFVASHMAELVHLIRNEADRERHEHPLNRLMEVAEGPGRINVATTDIHLPQRLGEAVKRAYDGELTVKYGVDDYSARAHWRR